MTYFSELISQRKLYFQTIKKGTRYPDYFIKNKPSSQDVYPSPLLLLKQVMGNNGISQMSGLPTIGYFIKFYRNNKVKRWLNNG